MYRIFYSTMILLFFMITAVGFSQTEIKVGDVALSGMKWGDRTIDIELTNNTEYVKYIVAHTDIAFEGIYKSPAITYRDSYLLLPETSITIKPKITIPGNYGKAEIRLNLYDVVDTLDELLSSQIFYEQPFFLMFKPRDEIFPYLQEKITFPPRLEEHPLFSNEFIRLFFVLISEGKSLEEIAVMNKCELSFVEQQAKMLASKKYLKRDNDHIKLTFPIISLSEAETARKIAGRTADSLTALIAANMKGYQTTLDSMITADMIPNDSNDFISGASLLFKPTPVVSTLVLWFELGKKFITRSAPLLIYDGTEICNAGNVQYMYASIGGDHLNGRQFFGLFYGPDSYAMMFSDGKLDVICENKVYLQNQNHIKNVWKYNYPNFPEYFIVDSTNARPIINQLVKDTDPLLASAYQELKDNALANGQENVFIGHRYWFWNLVASLTLDNLFEQDILKKREKQFFRFDKIKRM